MNTEPMSPPERSGKSGAFAIMEGSFRHTAFCEASAPSRSSPSADGNRADEKLWTVRYPLYHDSGYTYSFNKEELRNRFGQLIEENLKRWESSIKEANSKSREKRVQRKDNVRENVPGDETNTEDESSDGENAKDEEDKDGESEGESEDERDEEAKTTHTFCTCALEAELTSLRLRACLYDVETKKKVMKQFTQPLEELRPSDNYTCETLITSLHKKLSDPDHQMGKFHSILDWNSGYLHRINVDPGAPRLTDEKTEPEFVSLRHQTEDLDSSSSDEDSPVEDSSPHTLHEIDDPTETESTHRSVSSTASSSRKPKTSSKGSSHAGSAHKKKKRAIPPSSLAMFLGPGFTRFEPKAAKKKDRRKNESISSTSSGMTNSSNDMQPRTGKKSTKTPSIASKSSSSSASAKKKAKPTKDERATDVKNDEKAQVPHFSRSSHASKTARVVLPSRPKK